VLSRSYQLIATASRDGHVRVFRLEVKSVGQTGQSAGYSQGQGNAQNFRKPAFNVEMVADFTDHQGPVSRVEWNVTGTILSSSGEDGKVRLWKSTYLNDWKLISVIGAEQPHTELNR
jgi:nucleoporin SEH1